MPHTNADCDLFLCVIHKLVNYANIYGPLMFCIFHLLIVNRLYQYCFRRFYHYHNSKFAVTWYFTLAVRWLVQVLHEDKSYPSPELCCISLLIVMLLPVSIRVRQHTYGFAYEILYLTLGFHFIFLLKKRVTAVKKPYAVPVTLCAKSVCASHALC